MHGNHNLKFGLDYRWIETNGIDPWQSMGWFYFNALETGLPGVNNTGNAIASFLLGAADRGVQRQYAYFPRNRYQYYATYAQDDWKVSRKLTHQLRRCDGTFTCRATKSSATLSTFDLGAPNPGAGNRPGALVFFGDGPGRNGQKRLADIDWKAFAPRLGLAYQLTPKTVLRSGYGIYYALGNANAGLARLAQFELGIHPGAHVPDPGCRCHAGFLLGPWLSAELLPGAVPDALRRQTASISAWCSAATAVRRTSRTGRLRWNGRSPRALTWRSLISGPRERGSAAG